MTLVVVELITGEILDDRNPEFFARFPDDEIPDGLVRQMYYIRDDKLIWIKQSERSSLAL